MLLKNCNLECLKIENKHCQALELSSIDSLKGNIESKCCATVAIFCDAAFNEKDVENYREEDAIIV